MSRRSRYLCFTLFLICPLVRLLNSRGSFIILHFAVISDMRIVAIGRRPFVTGLQLAGVEGKEVSTPKEALANVKSLMATPDIGMIIMSDDIEKNIRIEVSDLRLNQPVPIIYSVTAPGGKQEKVNYRDIVKQMLKIG